MTKTRLLTSVADPAVPEAPPRQFIRRAGLKKRYPFDERTLDKMVRDGRLPEPYYFGARLPVWDVAELDAYDRKAKLQELVTPARRARVEASAT